MTAYTLAGSAATAPIGGVLGWLDGTLVPGIPEEMAVLCAAGVGTISIARELGWLPVPLLQFRRQTHDVWSKEFPDMLAAVLWGLDLGLVFTTWLSFSGVWVLAAMAMFARSQTFGAILFASHWLGRALSVWVSRLLLKDARDTPYLIDEIARQRRLFQSLHLTGLCRAQSLFRSLGLSLALSLVR